MFKMVNGVETALTEEEILEFQQREEAHRVKMEQQALVQYQEDRKLEYPSLDAMLVALIEKEEGRPDSLNALMEQRAAIKLKYPKPQ